jgi:SAM-dependent methyltransferase
MPSQDREFYNELWTDADLEVAAPDPLLIENVEGMQAGRALELGCGIGANAVWLAGQGWKVTAVDFSETAIAHARRLAEKRGVNVDFQVGDATAPPDGPYDLAITFYIQLQPDQRMRMLSAMTDALSPGGTLLFVSHDSSMPLPEFTGDGLDTLTTVEQTLQELAGLTIETAVAYDHSASGAAPHIQHMPVSKETGDQHAHEDDGKHEHAGHDFNNMISTVVRARKPA